MRRREFMTLLARLRGRSRHGALRGAARGRDNLGRQTYEVANVLLPFQSIEQID
jgi:hypothetical protein